MFCDSRGHTREAVISESTIKVGGIPHITVREGINMKVGLTSNRRLNRFFFSMTSPALLSNVSTSSLLEALIARFDNGLSLDEPGSATYVAELSSRRDANR